MLQCWRHIRGTYYSLVKLFYRAVIAIYLRIVQRTPPNNVSTTAGLFVVLIPLTFVYIILILGLIISKTAGMYADYEKASSKQ